MTVAEWQEVLDRFHHRCPWCGSAAEPLHMDHVIPLAQGGWHAPDNVQPLCKSCNSAKRDRIIVFDPGGNGIRVVDLARLVQAVAAGHAPLNYLQARTLALDIAAREHAKDCPEHRAGVDPACPSCQAAEFVPGVRAVNDRVLVEGGT